MKQSREVILFYSSTDREDDTSITTGMPSGGKLLKAPEIFRR
jgi:hypothetical protein